MSMGGLGLGGFFGSRMLEKVKKFDSPGLLWKRIKLTSTRKANAKKRLRRIWQNDAVLKACSKEPLSETSATEAKEVGSVENKSIQQ